MGFNSLVDSRDFGRAVEQAGLRVEEGLSGGPAKPKGPARAWDPSEPRVLTAEERAAGLRRVKAIFGGKVPVVEPDAFAPRRP